MALLVHRAIIMGHGIVMGAYNDVTMGHGIVMGAYNDVIMGHGIVMGAYNDVIMGHGIVMGAFNDVIMYTDVGLSFIMYYYVQLSYFCFLSKLFKIVHYTFIPLK